jgi:serine phosphatase RsbU (regulator of sigma subunit)
MYTDGLIHAGFRSGESLDVIDCLQSMLEEEDPSSDFIADDLLETAVRLDQGRPADDISVVVLRVTSHEGDRVRRMNVRLPLDS